MSEADDPSPRAHLHHLFPVPLVVVDDVVNARVADGIAHWARGQARESDGLSVSNVGGWHSSPDLPTRGIAVLDTLFSAMSEHIRQIQGALLRPGAESAPIRFAMQAWAVVLRTGGYMRLHDHAGAHWSAVFYADAGNGAGAGAGRISFVSPVGARKPVPGLDLTPASFDLTPRTGQLIVFPGWLQHLVEPYGGQRERVVISANVDMAG